MATYCTRWCLLGADIVNHQRYWRSTPVRRPTLSPLVCSAKETELPLWAERRRLQTPSPSPPPGRTIGCSWPQRSHRISQGLWRGPSQLDRPLLLEERIDYWPKAKTTKRYEKYALLTPYHWRTVQNNAFMLHPLGSCQKTRSGIEVNRSNAAFSTISKKRWRLFLLKVM